MKLIEKLMETCASELANKNFDDGDKNYAPHKNNEFTVVVDNTLCAK